MVSDVLAAPDAMMAPPGVNPHCWTVSVLPCKLWQNIGVVCTWLMCKKMAICEWVLYNIQTQLQALKAQAKNLVLIVNFVWMQTIIASFLLKLGNSSRQRNFTGKKSDEFMGYANAYWRNQDTIRFWDTRNFICTCTLLDNKTVRTWNCVRVRVRVHIVLHVPPVFWRRCPWRSSTVWRHLPRPRSQGTYCHDWRTQPAPSHRDLVKQTRYVTTDWTTSPKLGTVDSHNYRDEINCFLSFAKLISRHTL